MGREPGLRLREGGTGGEFGRAKPGVQCPAHSGLQQTVGSGMPCSLTELGAHTRHGAGLRQHGSFSCPELERQNPEPSAYKLAKPGQPGRG